MALPSTIPTSFVPRTSSAGSRTARPDFSGAFSFFAYLVFFATLALSGALYFYNGILVAQKEDKAADLAKAQAEIDSSMAQDFIRLHNRLSSGQTLLATHLAVSGLFNAVQELLPLTVRLNGLTVAYNDAKAIAVSGTGVAKTFNALAATSASFAADGRIKDAVFSNLTINKDNSVSFSLSATLDPKTVSFMVAPAALISAPALLPRQATTTASTTTP